MGWSGNHDREKYVADYLKGFTTSDGEKVTFRKHHKSGAEDWFILDWEKQDGTKGSIITMMLWDGGMVKHMDETAHPYYYGCPVAWFDEVPLPEWSDGAYDWRMVVRGTPVNRCENCRKLDCSGHDDQLIVVCAWGDWHKDVPKGMVGVAACYGGRKQGQYASEQKYYLVPQSEYDQRDLKGHIGFIVDPARHSEWVTTENRATKEVPLIA